MMEAIAAMEKVVLLTKKVYGSGGTLTFTATSLLALFNTTAMECMQKSTPPPQPCLRC